MGNKVNGQIKECDESLGLPPKQEGWIHDPQNPNLFVLVEQYPPCPNRIKRLKSVCGGTLLKPYCNAMRTFVIAECVHCNILAQKLSDSSGSSDSGSG
jgi:hypothetical protein